MQQNGQLVVVVEIFSFTLDQVERDDMEVLKDEFRALKTLSDQLEQEVAMFNYQFFSHSWSDNGRRQQRIELNDGARKDFVDSMRNTFDKFEVVGHH